MPRIINLTEEERKKLREKNAAAGKRYAENQRKKELQKKNAELRKKKPAPHTYFSPDDLSSSAQRNEQLAYRDRYAQRDVPVTPVVKTAPQVGYNSLSSANQRQEQLYTRRLDRANAAIDTAKRNVYNAGRDVESAWSLDEIETMNRYYAQAQSDLDKAYADKRAVMKNGIARPDASTLAPGVQRAEQRQQFNNIPKSMSRADQLKADAETRNAEADAKEIAAYQRKQDAYGMYIGGETTQEDILNMVASASRMGKDAADARDAANAADNEYRRYNYNLALEDQYGFGRHKNDSEYRRIAYDDSVDDEITIERDSLYVPIGEGNQYYMQDNTHSLNDNAGRASVLTEEEKQEIRWLYHDGGQESVDAYVNDYLGVELDKRLMDQQNRETEAAAMKANGIEGTVMSVADAANPWHVVAGIEGLSQAVSNYIGKLVYGDDYYNPLNPYGEAQRRSAATGEYTSTLSERIGEYSKFWQFVYSTGLSMAKNIGQMAMSGGSEAGTLAFMAFDVLDSEWRSGIENGLSEEQALERASVSALIEVITEVVPLDNLFNMKFDSKSAGEIVKQLAQQAFEEGAEEGLSDVLNVLYDNITNGGENEITDMASEYLEKGKVSADGKTIINFDSYEDALNEAYKDWAKQLGLDMLGGAVSGLAFGGGKFTATELLGYLNVRAENKQFGKDIRKSGNEEAFRRNAQEAGVDIKENASDRALGKAYREVAKKRAQIVTEALMKEDAEAGFIQYMEYLREANPETETPTEDVQGAISAAMQGDELTPGQQSILNSNPTAQRVVDEYASDEKPGWVKDIDRTKSTVEEIKRYEAAYSVVPMKGTSNAASVRAEERASMYAYSDDGKTYLRGEKDEKREVTPKRIVSVAHGTTDAVVAVTDADGNTSEVKLSDLTLPRNRATEAYIYAADMQTPELANAFRMTVNEQTEDLARVAAGMSAAYNMGRDGYRNFQTVKDSVLTSALTEDQARAAYELGAKDRAVNTGAAIQKANKRLENFAGNAWTGGKVTYDNEATRVNAWGKQKSDIRVVEYIAALTGINVEIFESQTDDAGNFVDANGDPAPNGSYDPNTNTIRLDINAGRYTKNDSLGNTALLRTMSHELTHAIQRNSPKLYEDLKSAAVTVLARKGGDLTLDQLITDKLGDAENTPENRDKALDEVIADACETMLRDSDAVDRLAQAHPEVAKSFKQEVLDFVKKLKHALRSVFGGKAGAKSREAKLIADSLDEIARKWSDALVETADISGRMNAREWYDAAEKPAQTEESSAELVGPYDEPAQPAGEHIDRRFWEDVGAKDVRSFTNVYPMSRWWLGQMAEVFSGDMGLSVRGEKWMTPDGDWGGQKRMTTDLIARLKDDGGYSWDDLGKVFAAMSEYVENGDLEAVTPNTALWKRAELILDEALSEGYTDLMGNVFHPDKGWLEYKAALPGAIEKAIPADAVDDTFADVENQVDNIVGQSDIQFSSRAVDEEYDIDNLASEYQRTQTELRSVSRQLKEIIASDEYKKAMQDAIDTGDYESYRAYEEEHGIAELRNREDELKKSASEARKAMDDMVRNQALQREENAIRLSGLSDAEYFRRQAVKEFGYTTNFLEAGYLLPNGKMLNFSGDKGLHTGFRGEDHRGVGRIFANTIGSEAMVRFMNDGNIRMIPEGPGIDISSKAAPTAEQISRIKSFVRDIGGNGFYVDISDDSGRNVGSYEYDGNIDANRVVSDIEYYYENGKMRESSRLSDFRYSTRAQTDTPAFREWFGDSKVVNEDGSPMLMYHGTNADFTVFDRGHIGQTGRFEGSGFNFTPYEDRAGSYGKNTMAVYLSIKNPLNAERKTLSVNALARIIREADPTGDNIIANYARDTRDYGTSAFVRREAMTTARAIWEYAENDVDIYSDLSSADPDAESLIEAFEKLGYDGVLHYGDDGKIRTAVAFSSNQIKSADPVTYDDSGNVIPLSERFNPANEDIRYSTRFDGKEYSDEITSILARFNNNEMVSQEELSVVPEIAEALAGHDYGDTSKINTPEREELRRKVYRDLMKLGSAEIDTNGKVRYTGIVERGKVVDIVIGLPAAGKSSVFVDPLSQRHRGRVIDSDEAKKMLPEFNNGFGAGAVHEESKAIVTDMIIEAIERGENIVYPIVGAEADGLRKKISKFKKAGYRVNLYLNELSPAKAIGRAVNRYMTQGRFISLDILYGYGTGPSEAYEILKQEDIVDEYAKYSNDVNYGESPVIIEESNGARKDRLSDQRSADERRGAGRGAGYHYGKAGSQEGEVDNNRYSPRAPGGESARTLLGNALYTATTNTREANLVNDYLNQVDKLDKLTTKAGELGRQIRDMMMAKGPRSPEYRQQLNDLIATRRGFLRQIDDMDKRLLRIEATKPLKELTAREKKNAVVRADTLRRLKTDIARFDTLLRAPTNSDHVPEDLKQSVIQFMDMFKNDKTVFSEKRISDMRIAYDALREEGGNLEGLFDDETAERLKVLEKAVKRNKSVNRFTLDELDAAEKVVGNLKKIVRDANTVFLDGRRAELTGMAERFADYAKAPKGKFARSALGKILHHATQSSSEVMTPYFFKNLGGPLGELGTAILNGEQTFGLEAYKAQERISAIMQKYNHKKWASDKDVKTFKLENGKEIPLTREQALSIYATDQRQKRNTIQQADHLGEGGVVLRKKSRITGEVTETQYGKLTGKDIAAISDWLTAEQKAYADEMVSYLSSDMSDLGNEVSMKLYGYKKFGEGYYFPYKVAGDYLAFRPEKTEQALIKNMGMTKSLTRKANKPVSITDFTEAVTDHIDQMLMYYSFAIPQDSFMRLYNYNFSPDQSVQGMLTEAYGMSVNKYIQQFMRDMYGGVSYNSDENLGRKLVSRFKGAAVLMSASVAIQQPSAFIRAMAYIDPKYFVGKPLSGGFKEAMQYSGAAVIKNIGRFDTNTGRGVSAWLRSEDYSWREKPKALITDSDYRNDLMGIAPEKMDELTWGRMWSAVKREQADKLGLRANDPKVLEAAGKRFTEVMRLTQVYDSMMNRSQIMRNKSLWTQMVTSFMAEPTVSINMLMDVVANPHKGEGGARKLAAVLGAAVLTTMLSSVVYGARDDDDDEATYTERYITHFIEDLADGINPLMDIPIARDVWSIFQGYDVERADMAIFADMYTYLKVISNPDKKPSERIKTAASLIGLITGAPVSNVLRDVEAVFNTAEAMENDYREGWLYESVMSGLRNNLIGGKIFGDGSKNQRVEELIDSVIAKDDKKAEYAYDHALTFGKMDEGDVASKVRKIVEQRFVDGDMSAEDATRALTAYGSRDDVEAEDLIRGWRLEADEGVKFNELSDEYTKEGSTMTHKQAVDWLVKYGGKYEEDADKLVTEWDAKRETGTALDSYGKMYLNGEITKQQYTDAKKKYGGQSDDTIEDALGKLDYQRDTGLKYDNMRQDLLHGKMTEKQAIEYRQKYGKVGFNTAYWKVKEYLADSADWSKYDKTESAIRSRNDAGVKAAVQELIDHSDAQDKSRSITDWISDTFKDEYIKASESERANLEEGMLIAYRYAYELAGKEYFGDTKKLKTIRDWLND